MPDLMTLVQAALLGVLEAGTEFLPVSSTGHLLLAQHFTGFEAPPGRVFEVAIQLGAIFAVVALYWKRLWQTLIWLPRDAGARRFTMAVVLAFLPAAALGVMLHGYIKTVLFNPWVVCVALILGGCVILWLEERLMLADAKKTVTDVQAIPPLRAILIGCVQCLALVPGVSRSGATIMGALALGLDRKTAAEFSFFLAIPTMFGAVTYDLYKNRDLLTVEDGALIAVGLASAFIVALLVVKWLVGFVSRRGFGVFAWYRIGAGSLGLLLLMLGF